MSRKLQPGEASKQNARTLGKIDADKLGHLAYIGLSDNQIADYFSVSTETLSKHYTTALAKKRAERVEFIYGLQMNLASEGDKTMLIWLGKQCRQSDNATATVESGNKSICITFSEIAKPADASM